MGIKKWFVRLLGISFIFIGLFVSFTDRLITGYAISSQVQNYFSFFNYFGIVIFLFGIFILLSSKQKELEKRVEVFSQPNIRSSNNAYHITDPELYFSNTGFVSLEDFKKGIEKIKDDRELIIIVRDTYSPDLHKMLKDTSNPDKQMIAREFWKALYGEEISAAEPGEVLDEDEKKRIMITFRSGWKNAPNSHQREVLSHYNLDYKIRRGSTHGEIYSIPNPHFNIITSVSPSDINAGRAIARDLIHMLERIKKEEK